MFVDVPGDSNMVPLRRAAEDAELIISFGGDGTFLHVARQILGMRIPLLGVNVGTKGFMAGWSPRISSSSAAPPRATTARACA